MAAVNVNTKANYGCYTCMSRNNHSASSTEKETLVDYLQKTGHPVEAHCRQGHCGTCRYPANQINIKWQYESEDFIAWLNEGEVLTCQAYIKETTMKDVMIDLETLGTVPGCVILSIGAVAFDPASGQLGEEFYCVVNTESCKAAGLHEDQDTVDWWQKQNEEAKEVLLHADEGGLTLEEGMSKLTKYLEGIGIKSVRIWGNGADFDNAILAACYKAVGQKTPWSPWNGRCYRTLKNLIKGPKLKREGTYHNALDDAKTQAKHAIQLLR